MYGCLAVLILLMVYENPYAPINVKSHYPPPGLTRGFGEDLIFRKIKYSTHRGTTGGQISVYYGWNAL